MYLHIICKTVKQKLGFIPVYDNGVVSVFFYSGYHGNHTCHLKFAHM